MMNSRYSFEGHHNVSSSFQLFPYLHNLNSRRDKYLHKYYCHMQNQLFFVLELIECTKMQLKARHNNTRKKLKYNYSASYFRTKWSFENHFNETLRAKILQRRKERLNAKSLMISSRADVFWTVKLNQIDITKQCTC
jgi:hypothetical protein